MTEQIYTLLDIREFLLSIGLEWTGQIYDEQNQKVRIANLNDFVDNQPTLLFYNPVVRLFDKILSVSNFTLSVADENLINLKPEYCLNYDIKWEKFLIKKYGYEYARSLYLWIINQLVELRKKMLNTDHVLCNQEKEDISKLVDHYERMSYIPFQYLSCNEIQ